MKPPKLTDKEIRSEIRKLQRNLSRRITSIERRPTLPQYAVKRYRELEIPSQLSKISTTELRDLYRDLRYINAMKTATVKGAEKARKEYEPIREQLETLSAQKQGDVWRLYQKLYEQNPTIDKFKYLILSVITDEIMQGTSGEVIYENISELYDEAYQLEQGGNTGEAKVLFTQGLQTLRK